MSDQKPRDYFLLFDDKGNCINAFETPEHAREFGLIGDKLIHTREVLPSDYILSKKEMDFIAESVKDWSEIAQSKKDIEIKKWRGIAEKLANDLTKIKESCLCRRFLTTGFDYGESHKHLGKPKTGARWLTPLDIIVSSKALSEYQKGCK